MTDLSPAAQAVLKAACIHHGLFNEEVVQRRRSIAAALRAAADQVVPEIKRYICSRHEPELAEQMYIRDELLAIADELEAL
jgi:hypothetical protein